MAASFSTLSLKKCLWLVPRALRFRSIRCHPMSQTTLSSAASGTYRCIDVTGEGEQAVSLKRMGICRGRHISVVQTGDPMILRVVGARVGLSRELAGTVIVDGNGVNADRGSSVSGNGDNRD